MRALSRRAYERDYEFIGLLRVRDALVDARVHTRANYADAASRYKLLGAQVTHVREYTTGREKLR